MFEALKKLNPFEAEEGAPTAAPATAVPTAGVQPAPVTYKAGVSFTSVVAQDDPMLLRLRAAATARITPFKTMIEAMEKLRSIIPDDNVRAQAAYATVSNDARTPALILQAIDQHIMDLNSEKNRFVAASDTAKRNEITGIENSLNNANSQLTQVNQQIENLTKTLAAKQLQAEEISQNLIHLQNDRSGIEAKYNGISSSFDAAFSVVNSELETQKSVLINVLK